MQIDLSCLLINSMNIGNGIYTGKQANLIVLHVMFTII